MRVLVGLRSRSNQTHLVLGDHFDNRQIDWCQWIAELHRESHLSTYVRQFLNLR